MQFIKFHGYGNDYIIFEAEQLAGVEDRWNDFARRVCDRHYGAGADGVAVVRRSEKPDAPFKVRIFNADGSEPAMSGNGTRCAVAYLYHAGLWSSDELRIKTPAGVKLYRLRERMGNGRYRFEAEIGKPLLDNESIPMVIRKKRATVIGYTLSLAETAINVTALQMCNPNCCVFVDDFDRVDWRRLGAMIERHERFPERTNVEFVRVRDRNTLDVRVWERGVGETESSGTGACAATVAAVLNNLVERRVTVEMPGGAAQVEWREDDEVTLTGTAEIVYAGEWKAH